MKSRFALAPPLVLFAVAGLLTSCYESNAPGNPNPGTGTELSSPTLNGGESYPHTFNTTGNFPYKCTIHGTCQGLFGTVVVVPASAAIQAAHHHTTVTLSSGGGCYTLSASEDSVRVGETVTWTNNSAAPHNVMSR
ncbi:MAG: hypothetical protein HZB25_07085 [Candidatus Eisenbacteria bacterium]|nr:hypothetical protein [Candidatus Eisenbacteria bacterium]